MATLEKIVLRDGNAAPGVVTRVREAAGAAWRALWLGPSRDPVLARLFGGEPVAAGVRVTEDSALGYAPVWQAVSLIAGDLGSLPAHVIEDLPTGGKRRARAHPLDRLLREPNQEMSAMAFRETLTAHVLTWGNGYAEIERDGAGRAVALWPLLPPQVTPYREAGQLRYRVTGGAGSVLAFEARDMIHVAGMGWDGVVGYSPIRQARQSLGLLAAAEMFGSTFFGNGTAMGGTLSHPAKLSDAARKNLTASVNARHQGPQNAHRLMILEEGMSYTKMGVDPNDAQFLGTRQFQIEEVCRWFNLPPHKLRHLEHSSVRANIEQEALDYVVGCLRPWCVRWEQELTRKLLPRAERERFGVEFNLDGLLRGDSESRARFLAGMVAHGIYTLNEARRYERMEPVAGGDVPRVPVNTVSISQEQ